jgi:uncharacterized protein (TIGR03066 family)
MNSLRIAPATVLVVSLLGAVQAQEKKADYRALIVGVWELTKTGDGGPPVGTTVEFTKDGKIKMTGKADGKEFSFDGTYGVEGEKLNGNLMTPGGEEKGTSKIKRLTDKELVTEDESGRVLEFKRQK